MTSRVPRAAAWPALVVFACLALAFAGGVRGCGDTATPVPEPESATHTDAESRSGHDASADGGTKRGGARAAAPGDASARDRQIVEVTVRRADDQPVVGAVVRAAPRATAPAALAAESPGGLRWTGDAAWSFETVTQEDGRAEFSIPRDEAWCVRADADGLAPDAAIVSAADGPESVTLRLGAAGTWSLRVVDPLDEAIPGARVVVTTEAGAPLLELGCDASGVARISAALTAHFSIHAEGFESVEDEELDSPDGRTVRVELTPLFAIAGCVVDTAGRPVADAVVRVDVPGSGVRMLRTSDDGSFRFDAVCASGSGRGFPGGATADGFADAPAFLHPGNERHRIVLARTASVEGIVVREDGSAAVGAVVSVEIPSLLFSLEEPIRHSYHTGESGTFRSDRLPPGTTVLEASVADFDSERAPQGSLARRKVTIDLAEGEARAGLRIILADVPLSYIRARVEMEGGVLAPSSARVRVGRSGSDRVTEGGGRESRIVLLDPPGTLVSVSAWIDGSFDPGGAPTGLVSAAVVTETSADRDAPPVLLRIARPVTVRICAVDPETGALIASADLEFVRPDHHRLGLRAGPVVVDPLGRISGKVTTPGRPDAEFTFDGPHEAGREYVVPVPAGAIVRGRVTDAAGVPVGDVTVFDGRGRWCDGGPSGEFELAGLRPGDVVLEIDGPDADPDVGSRVLALVPVTIPARGVVDLGTVRAWPLADLRGVVTGADGSPAAGAFVRALAGRMEESSVADGAGRYLLRVPSGPSFRLVAEHAGLGFGEREVGVVPERGAAADVVLGAAGTVRIVLSSALRKTSAQVYARRASGGPWWPALGGAWETSAWRELPALPVGDLVLAIVPGSGAWDGSHPALAERPVTVRAGATTVVEIGDGPQ